MQEYHIQDSTGIRAVILPKKGATVISLRKDETEFLYSDPENLASPERPRCGIPFLFPIFGRLQDGKYIWDGTEYAMAIHGFGHTSSWKVAAQTDTMLRLQLESDEDTLMQYPFRFRVTLEFAVEQGALTIRQTYENLDEKPMPYNYGFHPYFLTEKLENLRVETTADTFFDFAVGGKAFGHDSVSLSMPEGAPETGAAFMGVHGPTILHNEAEGKRLTMEFDESFHTHVLWSQAGKKFLCMEPVNGSGIAPEADEIIDCGGKYLSPGFIDVHCHGGGGGMEFGRALRAAGITGCMGHSNATVADVEEAMKNGYSCVVHLYSVMSTVTRDNGFRRGGLVEAGLLFDDLDVEIICDGCHLPPELIQLAVKCKGYDKLMLVSDCGPLGGFPEGEYEVDFGPMKMQVFIEDGVCKPPARNCFIGSVATGDRLVRTVYKQAGIPLWAAVRMATKTPARHCGYAGIKGEITVGADADLVCFDEDIQVSAVYLMGKSIS